MVRDSIRIAILILALCLVATFSLAGGLRAAPPLPAPVEQTLAYGTAPLQTLDITASAACRASPCPLVLFIHGGGWQRGDKVSAAGQFKAPWLASRGFVFASANYRLVPQATVEEQAHDVASALAFLLKQDDQLGIARGKVVLMGHSAGAHLVALVGTDPRYLHATGLELSDVTGIVAIDGAAYDIPAQMEAAGRYMRKTYTQAFGTLRPRQLALSPTHNTAPPNAAHFLLVHVQRPDGIRQAKELEERLRSDGTRVTRLGFAGTGLKGHMQINNRLGDPDYAATQAVGEWLEAVLD